VSQMACGPMSRIAYVSGKNEEDASKRLNGAVDTETSLRNRDFKIDAGWVCVRSDAEFTVFVSA
jgi:hypothetical protein